MIDRRYYPSSFDTKVVYCAPGLGKTTVVKKFQHLKVLDTDGFLRAGPNNRDDNYIKKGIFMIDELVDSRIFDLILTNLVEYKKFDVFVIPDTDSIKEYYDPIKNTRNATLEDYTGWVLKAEKISVSTGCFTVSLKKGHLSDVLVDLGYGEPINYAKITSKEYFHKGDSFFKCDIKNNMRSWRSEGVNDE